MYEKLLEKVVKRRKDRGKEMQPPCTLESLNKLRKKALSELQYDIPDEYARLLSQVDGIEWNGLTIYATMTSPIVGYKDRFIEGFVEANLLHREYEPLKDFLVFGDSSIDLYVFNIIKSEFQIIDRLSLDLTEIVSSFNHLIAKALEEHL